MLETAYQHMVHPCVRGRYTTPYCMGHALLRWIFFYICILETLKFSEIFEIVRTVSNVSGKQYSVKKKKKILIASRARAAISESCVGPWFLQKPRIGS